MLQVIKKDGTLEEFNNMKIINACKLASQRALDDLSTTDYNMIVDKVKTLALERSHDNKINVSDMHYIVEKVLLDMFPNTGNSYREYRNYKKDFVHMMDKVYTKSQSIRFIGDLSNANSDATMVSTQRSLIYGYLNKTLYKKFFLNQEERQAVNDGYIYIHDMKDRLDSMNCCLFDMANVITGGFEMGNVWYNEPKTLDVAFDVIADVVLSAASQQYGGFTIPRVDALLEPYAKKSYQKYLNEFYEVFNLIDDKDGIFIDCPSTVDFKKEAHDFAIKKVKRDLEQGFQAWEYRFNTVSSSRGDYPFTSISFGIDTSKFGVMISEAALKVRMEGQGKEDHKKPVLFPKLTFLYDENLHGEGKELEWLFDLAIDCSSKAMYPDFLSLTGEGYIPSMYKKYGKVVSLMGKCKCSPC